MNNTLPFSMSISTETTFIDRNWQVGDCFDFGDMHCKLIRRTKNCLTWKSGGCIIMWTKRNDIWVWGHEIIDKSALKFV